MYSWVLYSLMYSWVTLESEEPTSPHRRSILLQWDNDSEPLLAIATFHAGPENRWWGWWRWWCWLWWWWRWWFFAKKNLWESSKHTVEDVVVAFLWVLTNDSHLHKKSLMILEVKCLILQKQDPRLQVKQGKTFREGRYLHLKIYTTSF